MEHVERQIVAWLALLLGAWFIARAAHTRREKGAMKELLGLPIDKVKLFRNFFIQRLEAVVGFSFVLIGVAIHLYVLLRRAQTAASEYDPGQALRNIVTYLAVAIVAMLVITAAMHAVCSWFSRRIFLDILAYLMVRYDYRLEEDTALLMQIGEILQVPRAENDTVETYTRRIEEALRLEEISNRLSAAGKRPKRRPASAAETEEIG